MIDLLFVLSQDQTHDSGQRQYHKSHKIASYLYYTRGDHVVHRMTYTLADEA